MAALESLNKFQADITPLEKPVKPTTSDNPSSTANAEAVSLVDFVLSSDWSVLLLCHVTLFSSDWSVLLLTLFFRLIGRSCCVT